MRGKRFSLFLSGIPALGATAGMVYMLIQTDRATQQPAERALWMGGFFLMTFVLGYFALQLAMVLGRACRVERPRMWWAAFLIACPLLFGIGFGGQYLFMYSKEDVTVPAEVDMVLLLDASGSMETGGYIGPRTEAACQFVDSLTEENRLQAVSFAGTVLERTDLLPLDSGNRMKLKQMIRNIDAHGATDFNEPLSQAMNTLNTQGRTNCNKAVILLTDGQSDGLNVLDPTLERQFVNAGIRVFTVRISDTTLLDGNAQDLVDLALATGGLDTLLMPQPDGSIDTAEMLKAFREAFEATSQTKVNMREGLLVHSGEGVTLWQFLVRLAVMLLCAMVVGFGYFCRISPLSLISSAVMGLLAAVLITLLEGGGIFLCGLITVILVKTPFVFLDLRGEDRIDV